MLHLQMNVLATGEEGKKCIHAVDSHTKCDWNPPHEWAGVLIIGKQTNKQAGVPAVAILHPDACPKFINKMFLFDQVTDGTHMAEESKPTLPSSSLCQVACNVMSYSPGELLHIPAVSEVRISCDC